MNAYKDFATSALYGHYINLFKHNLIFYNMKKMNRSSVV